MRFLQGTKEVHHIGGKSRRAVSFLPPGKFTKKGDVLDLLEKRRRGNSLLKEARNVKDKEAPRWERGYHRVRKQAKGFIRS
jgi:hypothetical protein